MTSNETAVEIVARLRAEEHRGRFMPGGGNIDAEGEGTMWGGEKIMELRNPDGPEAAAFIEQALVEASALREALRTVRQREVQMLGAGLSKRNWHEVETAYNQLRDRLDAALATTKGGDTAHD